MREIKFRAWIKDENRMIYHPNILECCIQELDFSNVCRNYIQGTNPDEYERLTIQARITNRFYGKGLIELMQYTGLKDKNGREIYEGDIVGIHNDFYPLEVMFGEYSYPNSDERHYGFYVKSIRDEIICPIRGKNENEIIIITNVYENDRF